jgi:hypothetical protein
MIGRIHSMPSENTLHLLLQLQALRRIRDLSKETTQNSARSTICSYSSRRRRPSHHRAIMSTLCFDRLRQSILAVVDAGDLPVTR